MSTIEKCSGAHYIRMSEVDVEIDPKVYKFISIIQSTKKINDQSILECLQLSPSATLKKIEKRQTLARKYAKILEPYVPREDGYLNPYFNYFQLVQIIKVVFANHIMKEPSLLLFGMTISQEKSTFYAKVEEGQPYIIYGLGRSLNRGKYGIVSEVYEIATNQFIALKRAEDSADSKDKMIREIKNLCQLHLIAEKKSVSVEGLQAKPFAIFNDSFVGYLGSKHDFNLFEWLQGDRTNAERIKMCKSIVRAYKNLLELDFWHGDLKSKNMLIKDDGVIIIDWEGSLPYSEAIENCLVPYTRSFYFIHVADWVELHSIFKNKDNMADYEVQANKIAKDIELFSLSMILFTTLTACDPFYPIELNARMYPDTEMGVTPDAIDALLSKNYCSKACTLIRTMLAHDRNDRPTFKEAYDKWEQL